MMKYNKETKRSREDKVLYIAKEKIQKIGRGKSCRRMRGYITGSMGRKGI